MRNRIQKTIIALTAIFALCFSTGVNANAMHIMEGYLPPKYCICWGIVCLPFLLAGTFRIRHLLKDNRKNITLLAMAGAFVFCVSSLKVPSLTGSCSHMTGTGLGAIMFGFAPVSILGIIVLLFQAILLAHGGLTTLGANTFSMAIAGPMVSALIYHIFKKCHVNKFVGIFFAAFLGDFATYCVTGVQLALAYPSKTGVMTSVIKFLGVFAPTQLPLAVLEGIITVLLFMGLEKYASIELKQIGFIESDEK